MGGLSGPAVKPIVLRMVYQCARRVRIPIIGSGGITTADDAAEYMLAGATAVQVGTATFVNRHAMTDVIDGLDGLLRGARHAMRCRADRRAVPRGSRRGGAGLAGARTMRGSHG